MCYLHVRPLNKTIILQPQSTKGVCLLCWKGTMQVQLKSMQHRELHQYLPCYVFFRDCIVFRYLPTHVHPIKSNPNPLNFHRFTQQFSPAVVVQQIPRRGRRKWRGPPQQTHLPPHPAGLGGKRQGIWPPSAQFQGQWERFNKKNTTCLGWEGLYSCISFKEDYVKIVGIQGGRCQDSMKKPTWIAKNASNITSIYCKSKTPRTGTHEIFTNAPLDYHQSSCQDSIWFIIIYNLNQNI